MTPDESHVTHLLHNSPSLLEYPPRLTVLPERDVTVSEDNACHSVCSDCLGTVPARYLELIVQETHDDGGWNPSFHTDVKGKLFLSH